jgi:hypothetical protein
MRRASKQVQIFIFMQRRLQISAAQKALREIYMSIEGTWRAFCLESHMYLAADPSSEVVMERSWAIRIDHMKVGMAAWPDVASLQSSFRCQQAFQVSVDNTVRIQSYSYSS